MQAAIEAPPRPTAALAVAATVAGALEGSGERLGFLAYVVTDSAEAALRGGLVEHTDGLDIRRGDIRAATRGLRREESPRVLLVELPEDGNALEMLDDLAHVCAPDTKVMVIGPRSDIAFYRELTQAMGVSEYLHTPITRDTVARLLGPHVVGVAPTQARERGGRIVTVLGARGGVGTTTIAVSLATQLSEATRGHVALLDLHLQRGTTALVLGVKPGGGLRVALEEPERIDQLFLERVSIPVGDRFRLVAAEEPLQSTPAPVTAGVERVISLLRRKFNHVVVDVPVPTPAAMRVLLSEAAQRVVVMGPDIASLRDAVALRTMLDERAGPSRTLTVLNRNGAPGSLKLPLLQEGLGGKPDVIIPDLLPLTRATMLGKSPLRVSSVFQKAIQTLTAEVSGVVPREPETVGKWWRLRGGKR